MQDVRHVLRREALLRYDIISRYDTFFSSTAGFLSAEMLQHGGCVHALFNLRTTGRVTLRCRICRRKLFAAFIWLYADINHADGLIHIVPIRETHRSRV